MNEAFQILLITLTRIMDVTNLLRHLSTYNNLNHMTINVWNAITALWWDVSLYDDTLSLYDGTLSLYDDTLLLYDDTLLLYDGHE